MFTVYIDDSGTAPDQPVVIAAALIVSAARIHELDQDWALFSSAYKFEDLHVSECVAHNARSVFASWNDNKVDKVIARARRIIKRQSVKAYSFTIHKEDFEAEAPKEWLDVAGHDCFTWALRVVLNRVYEWGSRQAVQMPFQYVFDWVEKRHRDEIEMLMKQFETIRLGQYEGRFSFEKRRDIPGLQCVDLLAWSCFARSRQTIRGIPMHRIAEESFSDLRNHQNRQWLEATMHTRQNLRKAIRLDREDIAAEESRRQWHKNYVAERIEASKQRKPKAKLKSSQPTILLQEN